METTMQQATRRLPDLPGPADLHAMADDDLRDLRDEWAAEVEAQASRLAALDQDLKPHLAKAAKAQEALIEGRGSVSAVTKARLESEALVEARAAVAERLAHARDGLSRIEAALKRHSLLDEMAATAAEAYEAKAAFRESFDEAAEAVRAAAHKLLGASDHWRDACRRFETLGREVGLPAPEEAVVLQTTKSDKSGLVSSQPVLRPDVAATMAEVAGRLPDPAMLTAAQQGHRLGKSGGLTLGTSNRKLWGFFSAESLPDDPVSEAVLKVLYLLAE